MIAAAAAALLPVGCGGEGAGGGDGDLQSRAETLKECLRGAGLQGRDHDAIPLGVESPLHGVEVTELAEGNAAQAYLFVTAEEASEARPLISLTDQDTDRSLLRGRAVVRFDYVPRQDERDRIEGCLTPPVR